MNKILTFVKCNTNMIKQFFKYSVSGALSFALDYLVFLLVVNFAHYQVATYAGMIVGLIVSYVMSKFWVFQKNKNNQDVRELSLFIIVTVIGFALTGLGMYIGVELFKVDEKITKFVVAVIVFLLNFIAKKYLVWRA